MLRCLRLAVVLAAVMVLSSSAPVYSFVLDGGEIHRLGRSRGTQCMFDDTEDLPARTIEQADALLHGVFELSPHPPQELPMDPDWSENPLGDRNWQNQFHMLRYTLPLGRAFRATGDVAYRDRLEFLLSDWFEDNPPEDSPSESSWRDHPAAWRAMTYACATDFLGYPDWIKVALARHGRILADPDFYVERGNHALNQNLGLLAVGCVTDERQWIQLALTRLAVLVEDSVDPEGVTNEQAIGYQTYNYERYSEALERMRACVIDPPQAFERVALMPEFLAHAILPDGTYAAFGDTEWVSPGLGKLPSESPVTYAATGGAAGQPPSSNSAVFEAGYAFTRTGWGTARPIEEETFLGLRFGPRRRLHGHEDGGSLIFFGGGRRLIVDPGKYKYEDDAWREHFIGPTAHNVVVVEGAEFLEREPTELKAEQHTDQLDYYRLHRQPYEDVEWDRLVVFSRDHGYALVSDFVEPSHAIQQLWHLAPDAAPIVSGQTVDDRGLRIEQLGLHTAITTVRGQEDPPQGWVSPFYGERVAAPTVVTTSPSGSLLTLLAPPDLDVTVEDVSGDRDEFTVRLRVNAEIETVSVARDRLRP